MIVLRLIRFVVWCLLILDALCRPTSQADLSFLFVTVTTPEGGFHTHTMSVDGCHAPNHELVGQFISHTLDRVDLPVGALQFRMFQELETIVSGCFMVSMFSLFLFSGFPGSYTDYIGSTL